MNEVVRNPIQDLLLEGESQESVVLQDVAAMDPGQVSAYYIVDGLLGIRCVFPYGADYRSRGECVDHMYA